MRTPAPGPTGGAYGMAVAGLAVDPDLLTPVDDGWPRLTIEQRRGDGGTEADRVGPDDARLRLRTGGMIDVSRSPCVATYTAPRMLSAAELLHPLLAPAAAVVAHWHGRLSFHAAAVVGRSGVWGLLGDRGSGKTSTAARLARLGYGIVCDDLLVVDEGAVFPGPRSLDLRADAAERLGVGTHEGVLGARERWRYVVPQLEGSHELRGWIVLGWGDAVLTRLEPGTVVGLLLRHSGLRVPPTKPELLLELAGRDVWLLRRRAGWDSLDETVTAIARLVDG